ncbi:putative NUDIX domain-containing protein [Aeromonas phage LAh_8]|uniref:U8 snoRNA-decapping enzyme n=1 Tax=Aeromonas phage LAh_8 TaxID=2591032 RepID=A0A514A0F7_9CAUD|nr:nudix hydrolase [Aeromonas phage LAh_8]QDH46768.1 putative NUDIX domain-containing protein [Aeromonas phage LAh_8]
MMIKKKLQEWGREGNACFLWMYAETSYAIKVFAQFRKDGMIGAPGGKVENGESLEQGLFREVYEETGIDIRPYAHYIELLCTMSRIGSQKHSHAYALKVSEKVLSDFQKHAATRAGSHAEESNGFILLPFNSWGTYHNVMGHNFSYSAKEELQELLNRSFNTSFDVGQWDALVSKGNTKDK